MIPAAPRRITSSINRCPSIVPPLMATNKVPARAWRESCVTSVTSPTPSPDKLGVQMGRDFLDYMLV